MKSFPFLALLLLRQILASDNSFQTTAPILDPKIPIHIGEVFWPPSMTFIAWLPTWLSQPRDWCFKAVESTPGSFFSLSGVDSLKIHDYFSEHAYITREGKRYAECFITPECVRMEVCEEAKDWDGEESHKYTGPGILRWSCWVLRGVEGRFGENGTGGRGRGEKLTDAAFRTTSVRMTAAASSSILGIFTPGVTGS